MSEWIKCSERLPEIYQQRLVSMDGDDGRVHMAVAHYNGVKSGFLGVNKWKIKATHWMPLPAPPEAS